ncbi:MAG TPA: hypothetical protein VFA85_06075 [Terriglobales bacterium]|nr:hypothetical protein [Terriglobales bacterium]
MTSRRFFKLIVLVGIMTPGAAFGQGGESNTAVALDLCGQDHRVEVHAFCRDLERFQTRVNQEKSSGKTLSKEDFKNDLNHLDLEHPDARVNFITALAPYLTANAVLSKAAASSALADAGNQRLDRQLGPASSSSGTTSLVSKAGSAELLSLALDTGVLTRSINGATATLSTNADQVFRLITGDDPDCTVTCDQGRTGWFQRRILDPTNLFATLDLAQRSSTTVPTSGQASGNTSNQVPTAAIPTGAGKLSLFTARYEVRNKFDPRDSTFRENWKNEVKKQQLGAASDALKNATDVVTRIFQQTAPTLDRDAIINAAQRDPTGIALANFFADYFSEATQKVVQDPTVAAGVSEVVQNRAIYRKAWFDALNNAAGNLFTFQYDYNRPADQPLTHDFKVIFARDFQERGMVTFNGSLSIYDTLPAGAKYGRLHYGQISAEYDRTTSGNGSAFQTQLSLAGYWQYQPDPSVLNIPQGTVAPGTNIPLPNGTQEFVGTAGSLWVTQAKLTIKGSGGVNIPIGVSWSNKTDLLQGSRVGAQVGISYNFSSLAGLFSGGAQ